jgi:hypothetical protein
MKAHLTRLARLEAAVHPGACPTCHNHPTRIVTIDEETGAENGASLPAAGRPDCGRPIWRELHIVGVARENMP